MHNGGSFDGSEILTLLLIQMVQTFTHGLMLAGTVVSADTSVSKGLSAGTYTCTVSDTVNGCSAQSLL